VSADLPGGEQGGVVSADDREAAGGLMASFAPGSRIAGYLLEEQIGQGGMAVVFRARDERLDRRVALKILAPSLAGDAEFQRRFISESRAAAAIDDPHIVPVFAAGEAGGVLFIATRYVAGGDAHSLLNREGPLPPARVVDIISPVASALDAAHRAGLVHRDVKPSNMLMDVLPGRPDHVYLSDFGLSKAVASTSAVTVAGAVLGTLAYMPPEQIQAKPLDGRADQYALACSAFALLTGAPPFQRDEPAAVLYAHLWMSPPELTASRPGLPTAVDGVLSRALAKAPDDRYASCGQFADALRGALGFRSYRSGSPIRPKQSHPLPETVWLEPQTVVRPSGPAAHAGEQAAGERAAPSPVADSTGTPTTEINTPVAPDSIPGAGGSDDGQAQRRRLRRRILIAASIMAAVGLALGFLLPGSPAPPPTVPISLHSAFPALTGDVYVVYLDGKDASAEISGEIGKATNGEVAELYAQQFPYKNAPTLAGSVIFHPAGTTAGYEFPVTPALATRYRVELFRNSTSSAPFASSASVTIYVSINERIGSSEYCLRPVCTESTSVTFLVPPSGLKAEMAKPLKLYFGVNLSKGAQVPPEPQWLMLGAGHGVVIGTQLISSDEFIENVNFSFRLGSDAYHAVWDMCFQDTEAADGVGLPGHHGCGNPRVLRTADYLG
jgi:serine/threonine protein kinase